jgi:dienelactone hydrolase
MYRLMFVDVRRAVMRSSSASLRTATVWALILGASPALVPFLSGQDLVERELRIPAPGAGKKGLDAVMVRPSEAGAHPLALINHVAPRNNDERRKMTAWEMLPQAREFARRGWTTVIVMRRGYGDSGGDFAEDARACSRNPDFYGSGVESANDLRAAIAYLSRLPEVDPTRIISVGRSAGGFATVALTAEPPPGLVAAISFAGGRGSPAADEVCHPNELIDAFHEFGKKSRIPMLWVYSENDHFFSPQLAAAFHRAFTSAGATAQLVHAEPFRADGHGLFSLAGIPIWTGMVERFLESRGLGLRKTLLALPEPPDIAPPAQLSDNARAEFLQFLICPMHRAFAVSAGGHFGYDFGAVTEKDARQSARERCEKSAGKKDPCTLYVADDAKVGG